ncbi:MAG: hypothetical protein ABJA02_13040 [Acidobacteriota bacterium]
MNNCRSIVFFVLLALVLFIGTPTFAQSAGTVGLYQGPGAVGTPQEIPPGTYLVKAVQMGAAEGKTGGFSVRVPAGYVIRLCENEGASKGGGGECEEFGEGTHDLRSEKSVSYIRVSIKPAAPAAPPARTPAVLVFQELNQLGRSQAFSVGMYRSFKGEFGGLLDNTPKSAIVAKGFRVRFCTDEGDEYRGGGDCEIHDEGRSNLRFSDSISFIEVIDLSDKSPKDESLPVILYEDGEQIGKKQGFDVGTFLGSREQFGKVGSSNASSLTVKKGFRALICSEEPSGSPPADNCEEFGPGKSNLRKKHSAAYLKVWKDDK